MSAGNILVVDDDRNLLELIQMRLESKNFKVFATAQEDQALETAREQIFDLSIIDLQLSTRDGISLMSDLHYMCPDMPVIILTAYGSIESAVVAMKNGVYGYLTKPFDHHKLLFEVSKSLENRRLNSEIKRLKEFVHEKYDFPNIVAKSEKMQERLMRVSLVARTNSTVYIHGESGTGKELIAKALHLGSTRQDKPSVAKAVQTAFRLRAGAIPVIVINGRPLVGFSKGQVDAALATMGS